MGRMVRHTNHEASAPGGAAVDATAGTGDVMLSDLAFPDVPDDIGALRERRMPATTFALRPVGCLASG